ncbi:hypothetical protein EDC39_107148 [Geothermobacter ehrlichii]|uniref:Uncharacterized protein n=1 Tax=Geothermobacter ehrlichii TaxID=213224 RepID=A0A5D3WJY0_9BACT|nr:hypothetical protein EDC39_107148 [Geothermobacter ehrlichii]
MITTELINGCIELEVDLVDAVNERNRQLFPEPLPAQAISKPIRETKAKKSPLATTGAIVQPVPREPQILCHLPCRSLQSFRQWRRINQLAVIICQCDDIDVSGGAHDQFGSYQGGSATNHQIEIRSTRYNQAPVQ